MIVPSEQMMLLGIIKQFIESKMDLIQENRYQIQYKPDNSPVTASDILLEQQVKHFLNGLSIPITLIGEESFDAQTLEKLEYVAVLDPIDGTENFCSGLKEWGVSLGIWHHGQHLGSLLMMPELGLSLMTGEKVEKVPFSRITGFSSSYHDAIATGIKDAEEYRVMGCAVYNIYNVIRGSYCRFINPKGAYIWDLLPGIMLALEHGCEVFLDDQPYFGEFLDPTRKYRVDIRHRYDSDSR
jgi:myo-inositol-1(or 4)-monophosphatase